MTVVVGTAGHIDHGKTTLLRALTGIDADRLPEERARGMTIDVGYAHAHLDDQTIDFVDVPGHDKLVGNMLVGAGEIDAAMLVVAADDGPRAQTLEHLELLDALGVAQGVAAVTKTDVVDAARSIEVATMVREMLADTSLRSVPIIPVSATAGKGLAELRVALLEICRRAEASPGPATLGVDRVFSARGRGAVVTGTLRGGPLEVGRELRIEPGGGRVRVREIQVHGEPRDTALAGRTALNIHGPDATNFRRGMVLTDDPEVCSTDALMVLLRGEQPHSRRTELRLHLGTDQVGARLARFGGPAAVLRLDRPVAAAIGWRFVLRNPALHAGSFGGMVVDVSPPRGISRRRVTPERVAALAGATTPAERADRRVELHGVLGGRMAGDVVEELVAVAQATVNAHHRDHPESQGVTLTELQSLLGAELRRRANVDKPRAERAAAALLERLFASGELVKVTDRVQSRGRAKGLSPRLAAAMDRLEAALSVAAPPPLSEAIARSGCPYEGVVALQRAGRIVRLEGEIAYSASRLRALEEEAVRLARRGPVTPAAFRDATGTSRKYVLRVLEHLDRRGVLRRTPDGHVLPTATTGRTPVSIGASPTRLSATAGKGGQAR